MFPEFKTERLTIRKILPSDQQKIFEGLSDPLVIKYYGVSFSSLNAVKEQMDWYEGLWTTKTGIWWAICNEDNSEFLGACGLNNLLRIHNKAELGFWLLPRYWGKGIIQEVVEIVEEYAFNDLQLHRIEAFVEVENDNSKKVLRKMNYRYEGTMVEVEKKNGEYISLDIFAKLNA